MAKNDEAKFQKWAKEVAGKLPDNLRNSWTAVTENEYEGRDEVMNAFLRQDDYTRKTTEVSRRADELESARQELESQREQLVGWYHGTNNEYQRMYQEYQRVNGTPQTQTQTQPSADELASLRKDKEELLQKIRQVDQGAWTMATRLSAISHKALKDGYSYDPDAIAAYSAKNHVPLETSWEILTAAERRQKQDEDIEKKLEAAKEEGRRDALSKIAPPDSFGHTVPTNSMVDVVRNNSGISDDSKRREEALRVFYEAGQSAN